MEKQVPDLVQIALLGGDPVPLPANPPAIAAQELLGGVQRVRCARDLGVGGHSGKSGRCCWRRFAQHLDEVGRARNDAADQRDAQQQVDGREPRCGEYVEHAEPVEPGPHAWMGGQVVVDAGGVSSALREDRSGDAGQGEQHQQNQGGAHAGQRAPTPAQPATYAQFRSRAAGLGDGHGATSAELPVQVQVIGAGSCRPLKARPNPARTCTSGRTSSEASFTVCAILHRSERCNLHQTVKDGPASRITIPPRIRWPIPASTRRSRSTDP